MYSEALTYSRVQAYLVGGRVTSSLDELKIVSAAILFQIIAVHVASDMLSPLVA